MIRGKLSLVLPAHNEEKNLPPVVHRALTVLPDLVESVEIVIVNDGSRDDTGALIDRMAAEHSGVVVAVHHEVNRGYGAALTSGFNAATGEHLMFMDSDQQFDSADLSYLAPHVGHYDIVAGYRIKRRDPIYRILYARIFKYAVRILFGVRLRDIDCAFKVFRADLVRSIDLVSPGALINTEIMAKATRAGATVIEVGVNHYPRPTGESSGGSPRVVFRAMVETLRLWRRMQRYEPPIGVTRGTPASRPAGLSPLTALAVAATTALAAIGTLWRRTRS